MVIVITEAETSRKMNKYGNFFFEHSLVFVLCSKRINAQ